MWKFVTTLLILILSTVSSVSLAATGRGANDGCTVLYHVIVAGLDDDRILDQVTNSMAQQFATANPTLIKIEAQYPGFSNELAHAMRPWLKSYSDRVRLLYQPRMVAACSEALTSSEALDIAQFYRSPVGRKLLTGMSAGYDGKATVASGLHDGDVHAAVDADRAVATRRAMSGLSQADLLEIARMARAKPALFKFKQFSEKITPIRVAIDSEAPTAEEQAELAKLVNATVAQFLAQPHK